MTINNIQVTKDLALRGRYYVQRRKSGHMGNYFIVCRYSGEYISREPMRQKEALDLCDSLNQQFVRQYFNN